MSLFKEENFIARSLRAITDFTSLKLRQLTLRAGILFFVLGLLLVGIGSLAGAVIFKMSETFQLTYFQSSALTGLGLIAVALSTLISLVRK